MRPSSACSNTSSSWLRTASKESNSKARTMSASSKGAGAAHNRRTLPTKNRRPSSCSSSAGSQTVCSRFSMGKTPWVPSIGGGIHTSYTRIGQGEIQPQLARPEDVVESRGVCLSSTSCLKIPDPKLLDLEKVAQGVETPLVQSQRKLVMCPHLLANGICRLPSCTYVHEAYRPSKERLPLFGVKSSRCSSEIPCRFEQVLGFCPNSISCPYGHGAEAGRASSKPPSASTFGGSQTSGQRSSRPHSAGSTRVRLTEFVGGSVSGCGGRISERPMSGRSVVLQVQESSFTCHGGLGF